MVRPASVPRVQSPPATRLRPGVSPGAGEGYPTKRCPRPHRAPPASNVLVRRPALSIVAEGCGLIPLQALHEQDDQGGAAAPGRPFRHASRRRARCPPPVVGRRAASAEYSCAKLIDGLFIFSASLAGGEVAPPAAPSPARCSARRRQRNWCSADKRYPWGRRRLSFYVALKLPPPPVGDPSPMPWNGCAGSPRRRLKGEGVRAASSWRMAEHVDISGEPRWRAADLGLVPQRLEGKQRRPLPRLRTRSPHAGAPSTEPGRFWARGGRARRATRRSC